MRLMCLTLSQCAKEAVDIESGTDPDPKSDDSTNENDSDTNTNTDTVSDNSIVDWADSFEGFDTETCLEYELDTSSTHVDWKLSTVGCVARYYEIKIGDVRNDGVNRIYAALHNGHLVEWSYLSDDTWEMRHIGGVPGGANERTDKSERMISIWIGPGRNDGINRVYAANTNGNTYEFTYNTTKDNWEVRKTVEGNFQTGVVVGDLRNDGVDRIISTGHAIPVNEFSWDDNAWEVTAVSDGTRSIWPSFIGQARNDGYNRLYCPDWSIPYLREFSWNGTTFEEVEIETAGKLVKAIVGEGRNDGVERVYASVMHGHVIEYTSDSSGNWTQIDIMEGQEENHSRYGLYLAKTHDDDIYRLYSVAQRGKLTEHIFKNNTWTNTDIDAISGASADLTIGKARNDDINRVYVAGSNGVLYEYTHSDFAK